MLLWIIFALLTVAVLAVALQPLARPGGAAPQTRAGHDIAVYRAQLAELDDDIARGTLAGPEAEAARIEVSRRLLKAADTNSGSSAGLSEMWRTRVLLAATMAVPIVALSLYVGMGGPVWTQASLSSNEPSMDDLIARVESRLKTNPEDGRGWDVIAPVYRRLGRYADAANAYATAAKLLGDTAARAEGEGEARILAADGVVSPAAEAALARAIGLDDKRVLTRFWLAVAAEQAGRTMEARLGYSVLVPEAPPGTPLRQMLDERLAALGAKPAAEQMTGGTTPAVVNAAPDKGPNAADIANAAGMNPQDRMAMITGMVDGLAQRLATNGRDLAGWQKLIRAYVVLQQRDKAVAALTSARTALADDPAAIAALAAAAREAGLEP